MVLTNFNGDVTVTATRRLMVRFAAYAARLLLLLYSMSVICSEDTIGTHVGLTGELIPRDEPSKLIGESKANFSFGEELTFGDSILLRLCDRFSRGEV